MKRNVLYIWIVLIILIWTRFVINNNSENWNNWVNADDKSIEISQWLESGYQIIESNNTACNLDTDCETPAEYLLKSDCPYQSKCIQDTCTIICPDFHKSWEQIKQAIYRRGMLRLYVLHDYINMPFEFVGTTCVIPASSKGRLTSGQKAGIQTKITLFVFWMVHYRLDPRLRGDDDAVSPQVVEVWLITPLQSPNI